VLGIKEMFWVVLLVEIQFLEYCLGHFLYRVHAEWTCCKVAKLQAGIKPTALCSAINKENFVREHLHLNP